MGFLEIIAKLLCNELLFVLTIKRSKLFIELFVDIFLNIISGFKIALTIIRYNDLGKNNRASIT